MTIDRTKLREAALLALGEPWTVSLPDDGCDDSWGVTDKPDLQTIAQMLWEKDANYIVALQPATVLALLDELDVAEKALFMTWRDILSYAHSDKQVRIKVADRLTEVRKDLGL